MVPYNIAFKYFSIVSIVFNIMLTPFWSAFTEAYYKKDYDWINIIVIKLRNIWKILCMCIVMMLIVSNIIYTLWVGKNIKIPFQLSFFVGIYIIISSWNNIYAYFINGVGKIRLQLYSSILIGIINIPLCIYLSNHLKIGTASIVFLGHVSHSLFPLYGLLYNIIK